MPEPVASTVLPHQQRVIDEKAARDGEITRLNAFIGGNAMFATLPEAEQARPRRWLAHITALAPSERHLHPYSHISPHQRRGCLDKEGVRLITVEYRPGAAGGS